jgi:acyl carrier protein
MDSLDVVELTMAVEDEFNIDISDDVLDSIVTVGDLVEVVEKKL